MPKIPIVKTNYKSLTQVFPVPQLDSNGNLTTNSDGEILNQAMNIRTELYVDVNLIAGASLFFDTVSNRLRSNYTQVHVVGLSVNAFPIVLREPLANIIAYMNQRNDCDELCNDGCNCPT